MIQNLVMQSQRLANSEPLVIDCDRPGNVTQRCVAFDEQCLDTVLAEQIGGSKPGRAGADDDYRHMVAGHSTGHLFKARSSTIWASAMIGSAGSISASSRGAGARCLSTRPAPCPQFWHFRPAAGPTRSRIARR